MKTVADHEVLHEALAKLTLGAPLTFKGLGIVPLLRFDEAKAAAHHAVTPTGAMSDVFESRHGDLEAYREALKPEAGQVGAIVYVGNEWCALELLPGPRLFKKAWERLLPGYAMEALSVPAGRRRRESPAKRLTAVLGAPLEAFPAVGVGEDYRFRATDFLGAALVAEGRLAHLMAFPV